MVACRRSSRSIISEPMMMATPTARNASPANKSARADGFWSSMESEQGPGGPCFPALSGLRNADRIRRDLRLAGVVQLPGGRTDRRHGRFQSVVAVHGRKHRAVGHRILLQGLRVRENLRPDAVQLCKYGSRD